VLRSGPFTDERVIGLLNQRFIPIYFDLSSKSPASDIDARKFVIELKPELGGSRVPTPPVLFVTADGELLGEVSNYASESEMLGALRDVLRKNSQYARPSDGEDERSRLARAHTHHYLGQDEEALALLSEPRIAKESLFVAQIARRAGDLDIAAKVLEGLDAKKFADDITLEHGLLAFARSDVKTMRLRLAAYSEEGARAPEARYFLGISLFHLGEHAQARATWKKLIEQYGEHPFSYRADWAYTQTTDEGLAAERSSFTTEGPKSLLGRHGYMGRKNPDLTRRSD
jgi:tetratricopeptide (TPR) repeat protein